MISVRPLDQAEIAEIIDAPGGAAWRREATYWQACLAHQAAGERVTLIGRIDGKVAGYCQLAWRSQYPPYQEARVPEINDLRVADRYRRQGIGAAIVRRCERMARAAGRPAIGLGVGLHAGYGAAQRLYVRLGYLPDGRGVTSANAAVAEGRSARVDDEFLLWMLKPLPPARTRP